MSKIHQQSTDTALLAHERADTFLCMSAAGGMMGAYTYMVRGGVFCNAQTGNFVKMACALGTGDVWSALYYLIPLAAYMAGAMFVTWMTAIHQKPILSWARRFVLLDAAALFLIGLVPAAWPVQIVQVAINFLASMQYATFTKAEGFAMATTFCTGHVRQFSRGLTLLLFHKASLQQAREMRLHLYILFFFTAGGALMAFGSLFASTASIWLAVPVLLLAWQRMGKEHL